MNYFEKKHSILIAEFDRYVIEHPEFAAGIPQDAMIVLQLQDDNAYNEWSRSIAQKQKEKKQPTIQVMIKGLRPAHSRLIQPMLKVA